MRISIVNGICVRHDAISEAVRGTALAVRETLGADVRLFTYAMDFNDIPTRIVKGVSDILLDPFFMESDFILYHFGVYYDLFNALLIGNAGHGQQVVRYHNVTPKELLPASQAAVIERSLRQRANIAAADHVWADSMYNRDDLVAYGIDPTKISVLPLYLRFGAPPTPVLRVPGASVELLYVGRFVRSKGLTDLIEALATIRPGLPAPVMLRLAGNVAFSDAAYITALMETITRLGLDDIVRFEGSVSDATLQHLYKQADIFVMPSYHEGFCLPVLEALRARCVPVAFGSGNLPGLIGNLGVIVETGDRRGLGAGIAGLVNQFAAGRPQTITLPAGRLEWPEYDAAIEQWLERFTFEQFAKRISASLLSLRSSRLEAEEEASASF